MTTQEKIEVMQAYADGKEIQVKCITDNEWRNWTRHYEPIWNWNLNIYRIKPEEKYRPYKDTDEMIEDFKKRFNVEVPPYAMPEIWVEHKTLKERKLITRYESKTAKFFAAPFDMNELFEFCTYLDGSPCGIKE